MDAERFISSSMNAGEEETEVSLRPKTFTDYVGQDKIKSNLAVFIEAAKKRGDSLDHVLLYGPPGLGKTTMSHIIANELGVAIKITSGPAIEHAGDLAAILTNLEESPVRGRNSRAEPFGRGKTVFGDGRLRVRYCHRKRSGGKDDAYTAQ